MEWTPAPDYPWHQSCTWEQIIPLGTKKRFGKMRKYFLTKFCTASTCTRVTSSYVYTCVMDISVQKRFYLIFMASPIFEQTVRQRFTVLEHPLHCMPRMHTIPSIDILMRGMNCSSSDKPLSLVRRLLNSKGRKLKAARPSSPPQVSIVSQLFISRSI